MNRFKMMNSRVLQNVVCSISFVVMMLIVLSMMLYDNVMRVNTVYDLLRMSFGNEYEQSDLYSESVLYEAQRSVWYEHAQTLFGEMDVTADSIYDDQKIIDLGYADHIYDNAELTGITYRIQDLLQWEFEVYNIASTQFEVIKELKKEQPDIWYDEWAGSDAPGEHYLVLLNEQYLTSENKSLYDYALNPWSMEEYTNKLIRTVEYVQSLYYSYRLDAPESNLQMALISFEQGTIFNDFTHLEKGCEESTQKLRSVIEDYIRECGHYVIYNGYTTDYETNTSIREYQIRNAIQLPANSSFYIVIDDTLAVQDEISINHEIYQRTSNVAGMLIGGFVISLLLFVISFVRRTMLEGRYDQRERVISKWNNLVLLAVMSAICLVIVCVTYVSFETIYDYTYGYVYDNPLEVEKYSRICMMVLGAVYAIVFVINVLYFYLEMVRRLKEKTWYHKSFIYICICFVQRVWHACKKLILLMNGKIRFVLGYLAFVVVNLFGVIAAASISSGEGMLILFLLIIMDLVIGVAILGYFGEQDKMREQMSRIACGEERKKLELDNFHLSNKHMAMHINEMDQGISRAVENSLKDERMKTELITNVSHDIKTPLTSIITYVDLLKKEPIETENAKQYIEILDQKSARLKQLIDDLMEASKINSGNITVNSMKLCAGELLSQVAAEYESKLDERKLTLVCSMPEEPIYFQGDSRHAWRVLSNLFGNVCKYAMPGTRVYLEVGRDQNAKIVTIGMKNISQEPLNIPANELTERFVRGDESRNTEGNGLGLSIAKSLMQAMRGEMQIVIDGDLFKVILTFRSE